MTTALWITNVIVAILVISDMLYGRHMAKKWMSQGCRSTYTEEEGMMDCVELQLRDEELESRICKLEEQVKKPKRKVSKKRTPTKK